MDYGCREPDFGTLVTPRGELYHGRSVNCQNIGPITKTVNIKIEGDVNEGILSRMREAIGKAMLNQPF